MTYNKKYDWKKCLDANFTLNNLYVTYDIICTYVHIYFILQCIFYDLSMMLYFNYV